MANLSNIKLLALDVDGVLTDGTIIVNSDGSESKFFDVQDVFGFMVQHGCFPMSQSVKVYLFQSRIVEFSGMHASVHKKRGKVKSSSSARK